MSENEKTKTPSNPIQMDSSSDSPMPSPQGTETPSIHEEELLNKSYADSNSNPLIDSNDEPESFMGDLFHNISYEMIFGIVTGFFAFILFYTWWFFRSYTKVYVAQRVKRWSS